MRPSPASMTPIDTKVSIGEAILYLGDCLDIIPLIQQKVDMVLCDLPYGITNNVWDKPILLDKLWTAYNVIAKDTTPMVFTGSQPFVTDLIQSNRKLFRYDLIWKKSIQTGFLNANKMPLRSHEHILVFYKKLPTYNPQKSLALTSSFSISGKRCSSNYGKFNSLVRTGSKDFSRHPASVFKIKTDPEFFNSTQQGLTFHPTQKPVQLMEYLIATYTNEGDTVLDNCMGSGTTGVACLKTGRKFIGIEIDQNYYEHAVMRIDKVHRQGKLF